MIRFAPGAVNEFVVMPAGFEGDNMEETFIRLRSAIYSHNKNGGRKYTLMVSAGTAFYDPEKPCSISELLITADRHMYEQKTRERTKTSAPDADWYRPLPPTLPEEEQTA